MAGSFPQVSHKGENISSWYHAEFPGRAQTQSMPQRENVMGGSYRNKCNVVMV